MTSIGSLKDEMTSYDRLMTAFERKQPDRVPVTPFNREWCLRQLGFKFSAAMTNAEIYAFSQLYCIKKFGYDMVLDFLAVHAESEAMGSRLHIPEDAAPSVAEPAVKDYKSDLPKLKVPNPWKDGRLPMILKGIQIMKSVCEKMNIPVMGYVQAVWRHTCMLRGVEKAMLDVKKNPDELKELCEIALESLIVYGNAVAEAGADLIWVSDPVSSGDMISRKTFEEFVHPFLKREIKALKRTGVKLFLHICGNVNDRLDLMASTGVDAISVDEKVDLAKAKELIGGQVAIMGNLSPGKTLLSGKQEDVERESKQAIDAAAKGGGFILASGCLTAAAMPPENVETMVRVVKTYGRYQ
ncbi:TPA: hypothetical protein EYP27_05270 [Candidatus Bathyarchaeota archaeon]|nr:hypothetical protein [Candidatus Bathyarchaeota archaeon]